MKHTESLPEIVESFFAVLQESTPAVARQAIFGGTYLFSSTFWKVIFQGLYSNDMDASLVLSWSWMIKFKEKMYSLAFEDGSDGIRVAAVKFVEAIILLYTPDPNISSEPPPHLLSDEDFVEYNISWLRGGHPFLDVGDLSDEASHNLGLLLDELRYSNLKHLSCSLVIVIVNCLSAIANKRPSFYGRILPVLLGVDPSVFATKKIHAFAVCNALKKSFVSCLKCTHPGAVPWQDRLISALNDLRMGRLMEPVPVDGIKSSPTHMERKIELPYIKGGNCSSIIENDCLVGDLRKVPAEKGTEPAEDIERGFNPIAASFVMENEIINPEKTEKKGSGELKSEAEWEKGPVQQLISMFSALVSQGEKAVSSLEILIASISSDLLAEVVMSNMRHLPPHPPYSQKDLESVLSTGSHTSQDQNATDLKPSMAFIADIVSVYKFFPNMVSSTSDSQRSLSADIIPKQEEEVEAPVSTFDQCDSVIIDGGADTMTCTGLSDVSEIAADMSTGGEETVMKTHFPSTANLVLPFGADEDHSTITSCKPQEMDNFIDPDSPTPAASNVESTARNHTIREIIPSTGVKLPLNLTTIELMEKFMDLSPKTHVQDTEIVVPFPEISFFPTSHPVLPKMSAPFIDMTDEEIDRLQNLAFIRVLDSHKQILVAGGALFRVFVLASLGNEYPSELSPWRHVKDHIASDYANREGHEMTIRVLYKLYAEAEEDRDFFSSTTAVTSYETFLLTVVETLRDSFPYSDKSLSRLLSDVPYLPSSIFNFLGSFCSPEDCGEDEKRLELNDRVTQGLSAVWNLILLRPPIREPCLKIALQSAIHPLEEIRMKAIRLVANKLYPMPSISQLIEKFAQEMLFSVSTDDSSAKECAAVGTLPKDYTLEKVVNDNVPLASTANNVTSETQATNYNTGIVSPSTDDAQRCMSLYFALCTKKHSLFSQIFVVYKNAPEFVKKAICSHIPMLVRTIGSSSGLLESLLDSPSGCEELLLQVLHTLTSAAAPSPPLISTIVKLFDSRSKDPNLIMPILPFIPKQEMLRIFPHVVNFPIERFREAMEHILQGAVHATPVLTPSEVLISIHSIDTDRDGIPLKKVTDACNACFEERKFFTQQVIAMVLNQLVEQIPLPLLFMRTVLQAIGAFPSLVEFIMEILSRLVPKQIWKYPKLWVGFLKCILLTKPQSFSILVQLPPVQLENALNKHPILKDLLIAYATQPSVQPSVTRPILAVLGVAPQIQKSTQLQSAASVSTCEDDQSTKEEESVEKDE